MNVIDDFKKEKILVIGDLMIDHYLYGETKRISPEAPVPVVRILREDNILGGACNTANNIVSLGGKATVIGVVGNDEYAVVMKELLQKKKIKSILIKDSSRPTTVKKRIISKGFFQMMRIDHEKKCPISEKIAVNVFKEVKKIIKNIDAIIISDYAKGVMTEKLTKSLIKIAKENKVLVTVDSKSKTPKMFKGCDLIVPNINEAIMMSEIEEDIFEMGKKISSMLKSNVYITRGSEGISVFDKSGTHTHIPPVQAKKVVDVTGAGDTVIASATLALCSNLGLIESARLANFAGHLVVQKPGTATISPNELKGAKKDEIHHFLKESIEVKQKVIEQQLDQIENAAKTIVNAYAKGKKVIAFGNGGSASDAQHFIGELVGRFRIERKGLPGIALTTDTSVVTAIANDYGYDQVFERQIEANAVKGDVLFGISTSGNSPNVLNAMKRAKKMGCKTIGLTGKDGGKLIDLCDISIIVPSNNTPRIQEAHITIIHIICDLLDQEIKKNEKFSNILR